MNIIAAVSEATVLEGSRGFVIATIESNSTTVDRRTHADYFVPNRLEVTVSAKVRAEGTT